MVQDLHYLNVGLMEATVVMAEMCVSEPLTFGRGLVKLKVNLLQDGEVMKDLKKVFSSFVYCLVGLDKN